MKHLSDDQLALYHYRDGDDIEVAGWHLTSCAECRSRLAAIEEVLKLGKTELNEFNCLRASGGTVRMALKPNDFFL